MISGEALLEPDASAQLAPMPLVVDLDGTLIKSDLLIESAFSYVSENPARIGRLIVAGLRGKAPLKAAIASLAQIDAGSLPYDEKILNLIRMARKEGRPVYLASASNQRYVAAVADHLGLFDGWFASDDTTNLSSSAKARRLVDTFGAKGFDYIGNDHADLAVWSVARRAIAINAAPSVRKHLLQLQLNAEILASEPGRARAWIKLLRPHQWAKNALVAVPPLTAQRFQLADILAVFAAFLAFSLAASAIYIINDLVDLEADRKHPTKRNRPLAAGTVPILSAVMLVPVLLIAAFGLAALASWQFAAVLAIYVALTTAYSFSLKRKMFVDVIVLAGLYTLRVIGGAAAIMVPMSEWLLGFSMFIFTDLALIKRYIELATRVDADLPDPANRNYRKSDLNIVATLAAASGFNAVTVFALYVSSDAVKHLYRHPLALWLICPILMYWLSRALLMAHRRYMDDDPILFAMRDRNSLAAFGLIGLILIAAI